VIISPKQLNTTP